MTRRCVVLLPFAARLGAATAEEQVFDLFTRLASRLSAGDAAGFLEGFDQTMPGYEDFRANVTGLLQQAEVLSSIEFRRNDGTDTVRSVEADWFLQIKERYETGGVTRRRELVKCRVEKTGRRWKVFALEPQSLFAPVPVK
jgi:hypothetical protein